MTTQQDTVPSAQQYVTAFQNIKRTDHRVKMLRFHYSMPERTVTATQMAHVMGYEDHKNANLQYGGLGREVGKKLVALGSVIGEKLLEYGPISTLVTLDKRDNEWHWIMRPEVALALEILGLVEKSQLLSDEVTATTDVLGEQSPFLLPEEIESTTDLHEGAGTQITVNRYERNPEARKQCIDHYGARCCICDFEFSTVYGKIGNGYIHVHHLQPLAAIGKQYIVDPIADLRPVCPNCHAMVHCRTPPYTIEEMQTIIREQ